MSDPSAIQAPADPTSPALMPSFLERVDWLAVDAQVTIEQRNREVHTPPISVYRWWARRPHTLVGALLDAAREGSETDLVIADPFSGGGTVALEAARRGLTVYAQDLHPWATTGLRAALDDVDPAKLKAAADLVLEQLRPVRTALYGAVCPAHGISETAGAFWARRVPCTSCGEAVYLYPYPLLSMASRKRDEQFGYFGCSRCGYVTRSRLTSKARSCAACHSRLGGASDSLTPRRMVHCRRRGCGAAFSAFANHKPEWEMVLVQRRCQLEAGHVLHLDRPTPADITAARVAAQAAPDALGRPIPHGVETSLLQRAGFNRWADLYPPRQLMVLTSALTAVNNLKAPAKVKTRLRLAICGAAEMAGYASRWDRFYPKAFEAIANHRFAALGFSFETNLLGDSGRGTLPRRMAASLTAARWTRSNLLSRKLTYRTQRSSRKSRPRSGTTVVQGSSERQLLARGTADLVLTDPPYFDDVQYAELASLFLAWAKAAHLVPDSLELDLSSEAVANRSRGTGAEEYRGLLTRILRESRETLRPDGRLIITYHNSDLRAWWSLARALHDAGFRVAALAVAVAENASDHPKRKRMAFGRDLVIECHRGASAGPLTVMTSATTLEERELLAAGKAVGRGGCSDLSSFRRMFQEALGDEAPSRIRTSGPKGAAAGA